MIIVIPHRDEMERKMLEDKIAASDDNDIVRVVIRNANGVTITLNMTKEDYESIYKEL